MLPLPLWRLAADGATTRANANATAAFPAWRPGHPLGHLLASETDRVRLAEALCGLASTTEAAVRSVTTGPAAPGGEALLGDLLLRKVSTPDGGWTAVAAFVDLTQERMRECALDRALARANDAVLAKSDFVSAVSHELRTPLSAIVGFSQLLEMQLHDAAEPSVAVRQEWVVHLSAAARHLSLLVEDLLDQQAIESGRLRVQCVELPLRALVEGAVEMARHRFVQHGVHLLSHPPPDTARVHADPARSRQVLLNLLDNAAKYTPRGRSVYLETVAEAGGFRISVRDEGPGLTKTQQADLVRPFNRLGAERSAVPGLGLGLAISRQLMQRMGGEIGCDSLPGSGACFWCWLPAPDKGEPTAPP